MAKGVDDAAGSKGGQKAFTTETVAVLLLAVKGGNGTPSISKQQYEMMSALDGTRTADSFQHQLRAVTAKARELQARLDDGEKFEAVKATKKRGASTLDGSSPNGDASSATLTPAKKQRTLAKPRAKKAKTEIIEPSALAASSGYEGYVPADASPHGQYSMASNAARAINYDFEFPGTTGGERGNETT